MVVNHHALIVSSSDSIFLPLVTESRAQPLLLKPSLYYLTIYRIFPILIAHKTRPDCGVTLSLLAMYLWCITWSHWSSSAVFDDGADTLPVHIIFCWTPSILMSPIIFDGSPSRITPFDGSVGIIMPSAVHHLSLVCTLIKFWSRSTTDFVVVDRNNPTSTLLHSYSSKFSLSPFRPDKFHYLQRLVSYIPFFFLHVSRINSMQFRKFSIISNNGVSLGLSTHPGPQFRIIMVAGLFVNSGESPSVSFLRKIF